MTSEPYITNSSGYFDCFYGEVEEENPKTESQGDIECESHGDVVEATSRSFQIQHVGCGVHSQQLPICDSIQEVHAAIFIKTLLLDNKILLDAPYVDPMHRILLDDEQTIKAKPSPCEVAIRIKGLKENDVSDKDDLASLQSLASFNSISILGVLTVRNSPNVVQYA
ncbi:unnamed protein product [Lepeophtheirus salmonis]|uniref:(salmon louse) hypothetical protein n=1 Tax=Lepeophtheirus salmonis TaxID=72036 RepID=A0A7R8CJK5_LEPSM|nr:unnamed protein product [Lepeophtheirus salmonis]CAF2842812.1 unnamed protein product [Lepeophtheirus salmonis]